jgi:hypothetical protein
MPTGVAWSGHESVMVDPASLRWAKVRGPLEEAQEQARRRGWAAREARQ